MKLRDFRYLKEGGVVERYQVLVMTETAEDMSGISMGTLSQADQDKIIAATRAYESVMDQFVKSNFRKFRKGHVVELLKETK